MSGDDVLSTQRDYYAARAPEYDDWFERRGRYDLGPEANASWFAEQAVVEAALDDFAPTGRVLEIACGTGWWTQRLARHAGELTAIDASAETIERNRARVGREDVRYLCEDVFAWRPERRWDVVFFAFWLSHVPEARFEDFWATVDTALAPDGRVFFIDSPPQPEGLPGSDVQPADLGDGTVLRRLADGREFRIVKVFRGPEDLRERLSGLGWAVDVRTTPGFFLYGSGGRA